MLCGQYLLCSLEILDDERNFNAKADIFSKRTIKPQRSVDHVDTPVEALAVSIGEKAHVDLPYMAQLCGKTTDEVNHEYGSTRNDTGGTKIQLHAGR